MHMVTINEYIMTTKEDKWPALSSLFCASQ